MQGFETLYADLSKLKTDDEVAQVLREFFAGLGEVSSVGRFKNFETDSMRNFIIKFHDSADMIKVANRYQVHSFGKLCSFGFDGVLIELRRDRMD